MVFYAPFPRLITISMEHLGDNIRQKGLQSVILTINYLSMLAIHFQFSFHSVTPSHKIDRTLFSLLEFKHLCDMAPFVLNLLRLPLWLQNLVLLLDEILFANSSQWWQNWIKISEWRHNFGHIDLSNICGFIKLCHATQQQILRTQCNGRSKTDFGIQKYLVCNVWTHYFLIACEITLLHIVVGQKIALLNSQDQILQKSRY